MLGKNTINGKTFSRKIDNYKAFQEGIVRARAIRKDLKDHPTEYYPEKVRGLNKAYIDTVKEIIRRGDCYLDETRGDICIDDEEFNRGLEVADIIERYRNFLLTIER